MGPPSYMWSVVDRIVVMRRIPVGTFVTQLGVIPRSDGAEEPHISHSCAVL